MGCSLSCIVPIPKPKIKSIRIVRLNGSVEEINYPITVAEVTGNQPKDFLFTQASLLAAAATPLKMEAPLEAGLVYFLLPATLFQSNVAPVELAPIVRKLASIALNTKSQVKCSDQIEPLSRKSRPWKPILSTIRERSFNRRSESDLRGEEEGPRPTLHTKDY
ncbi:hypothetical protein SASPL_150420 [Salvia splendens]|uniref:Uncharacterized protein n=1 Tax=Salvia splendens TaxID=180675 RepID=A0A8X8W6R7_SALSN|nr:hypothetical protein SASPL_150420 [Salvia splendens]